MEFNYEENEKDVYAAANKIYESYIDIICGELVENRFLIEEDMTKRSIPRTVAKCLTSIISEKLGVNCVSLSFYIKGDWRRIYLLPDESYSTDFYKELLETRYM